MTPVEARNTLSGLQPAAPAAISAVSSVAARPDLPVNALALPELTTSALAPPPFDPRAAPVDRRRRAFRAGEYAGHGGAGIEQRQQHVGAARIADSGRRSRQAARRRPAAFPGKDAGARGEMAVSHDGQPRRRHARARPAHPMRRSNVRLGAMDCRVKPGNDNRRREPCARHFFTGAAGLSVGLGACGLGRGARSWRSCASCRPVPPARGAPRNCRAAA